MPHFHGFVEYDIIFCWPQKSPRECVETILQISRTRVEMRTPKVHKYFINLFFTIKSRKMRWVLTSSRIGVKRNICKTSVKKYEGKRPLGRPRRKWEDNVKGVMVWTDSYGSGYSGGLL
jgi:hypothetical protein